jgi:hypothetical protein
MDKVKFELNRAGVRALLQSQEMLDVCMGYANEIKSRAGDGYEVSTLSPGKTRVNASVEAVTAKAKRDNAENNTLLKAVRR